jgi:hypothetical protein
VVDDRLDTCLHIASAHAVILSSTDRPKRVTRSSAGDEPSGKQRTELADRPDIKVGPAGAERRGERVALHLGRPPALAVPAGHPLQRRRIGDPGRLALQNQVDALQPDSERAGRVRRQVASLAGAGSASEIQVTVEPLGGRVS